jgi:hypothetical protein
MSNIEKEPGPQGDSPALSSENVDQEKKQPREYRDVDHENQQATSRCSLLFVHFRVSNATQQRLL